MTILLGALITSNIAILGTLFWVVRALMSMAVIHYEHNLMWNDYARDHGLPVDAFSKHMAPEGGTGK